MPMMMKKMKKTNQGNTFNLLIRIKLGRKWFHLTSSIFIIYIIYSLRFPHRSFIFDF